VVVLAGPNRRTTSHRITHVLSNVHTMLYRSAGEIDFSIDDLKEVDLPTRVLMTSPEFFDVKYVINPHMAESIGTVNYAKAFEEWQVVEGAYQELGLSVDVLDGKPGLPDMVFCANQTLPYQLPGQGGKGVVLSEMYADERRREVGFFRDFFSALGYQTLSLGASETIHFEGMGDALWHPGRFLLWGGYGFRTDLKAYEIVSDSLHVSVCLLELMDEDFYHLDTCLSILDESTALIFPDAFTPGGLEMIRAVFSRVLEAPESEARKLFACNAHCPDRRHVLIQQGCDVTNALLRDADFVPVELDTGEYLKAGGSVFCMKQMFW